ncbi:MAG: DUF3488 and transglutaminase-like domain-containing protein [Planctomycetota bacterium]|nr:DUF3488 and transglutaminase-like domain-containing protein [Planctomycetota bacterium]
MYEIRHFKPALYLLLLIGITGFAVAAESPELWLLAGGTLLINAWLVASGRFVPMPRLIANIVTLVAFAFVAMEMRSDDSAKILTLGQYLVLLHLVKVFEHRSNRDYAQLLVLSFLLMVAAAISTASLIFGLLFIAYLFLALYVSLLFHLKIEADHARAMDGRPASDIPAAPNHDQRHLPSSMRRITAAVSVVAVIMAVAVFIFFPRGAGEGVLEAVQMRPSQALTGFTDNVSFQKIAQITQNTSVIARVEVYDNDRKVTEGSPLLLRGSALDIYNDPHGAPWSWSRSMSPVEGDDVYPMFPEQEMTLPKSGEPQFKQVINLQPTGTHALFAMAGAVRISFSQIRDIQLHYSVRDGILSTGEALRQPMQYTVYSCGQLPIPEFAADFDRGVRPPMISRNSNISPEIRKYASQPDVCGTDASGQLLANYPLNGNYSFNAQIAKNFEKHLRTFTYTLDLTDARNINGRDPIVAFLTDFKRGHCEYFAGAMALMCQSLGIPARVVVGFRCDVEDFNNVGNYYEVKQSNAHAWCEIFNGTEWQSFDPTSATEAPRMPSLAQQFQQFFDFLEFKWATAIVAYDYRDRHNLMDAISLQMTRTAVSGSQGFQNWWDNSKWTISPTVLSTLLGLMIAAMIITVGWYAAQQWRLRRRARRIGLESLPTTDRARLVRQLGFYDDLLRVLARHRLVRPKQLTPLEFSQTLSFLPSGIYDDIHRLTELFYRIRYGDSKLNNSRQRHLSTVVQRVQQAMDAMTVSPPIPKNI